MVCRRPAEEVADHPRPFKRRHRVEVWIHGAWKRATFLRYDYRRNMKAKEYVDGKVRTVKRTRCVGGFVVWADGRKVCYDLNVMRRIYGR